MTIRYKCDTCGSTLNIKDELAGTDGKCPKCKTAFTVPQPSVEEKPVSGSDTKVVAAAGEATVAKLPSSKAKRARSKSSRTGSDEFDPMAVLMGDDSGDAPADRTDADEPPLSDDDLPADLDLDLEIGEDDDEPRSRRSKKRKRVQFDSDDDLVAASAESSSAAATADAMLSGSASAGAKDLLTRTMEEGRARASRIEEERPEHRGPTLKDYLREYGPKGALILAGLIVGFLGLYTLATNMYGGGMPLPDLGRVYGTITLNGQPLEGANVRFTPVDRRLIIEGTKKERIRSSTAITDEDGYYDLNYTEGVRGAGVTEHRVIIMKFGPDGKLVTPTDFATYSMQTRTVDSGSNKFDFELLSDTPIAPPAPPSEE